SSSPLLSLLRPPPRLTPFPYTTLFRSVLPLYAKTELRAITNSPESLERPVMRSSVIPSLKYYCPASPLMFSNGSTATEGLSVNTNQGERERRERLQTTPDTERASRKRNICDNTPRAGHR